MYTLPNLYLTILLIFRLLQILGNGILLWNSCWVSGLQYFTELLIITKQGKTVSRSEAMIIKVILFFLDKKNSYTLG